MSAVARARYPYSLPSIPLPARLLVPLTWTKKSLVAIIPIYSRVDGGVSAPKDWNATLEPAEDLMKFPEAAKQFAFERLATEVCEVVVKLDSTFVSVPRMHSGVNGSRFTERTTNTSLSRGLKFKSTAACANVFAAGSSTENPIDTRLDVCFRPVGMSRGTMVY